MLKLLAAFFSQLHRKPLPILPHQNSDALRNAFDAFVSSQNFYAAGLIWGEFYDTVSTGSLLLNSNRGRIKSSPAWERLNPLLERVTALPVNRKDMRIFGMTLLFLAHGFPMLSSPAIIAGEDNFMKILFDLYQAQKDVVFTGNLQAPYIMFVGFCADTATVKTDYLNQLYKELDKVGIGLAVFNTSEPNSFLTGSQLSVPPILRMVFSIKNLSNLPLDALDRDYDISVDSRLRILLERNFVRRFPHMDPSVFRFFLSVCDDYLRAVLNLYKPSMFLIWNQFTTWSQLVADYAVKHSIPIMYMEHGSLPGSLCIESEGQMGESFPATNSGKFNAYHVNADEIKEMEQHLKVLRTSGFNRRKQPSNDVSMRLKQAIKGRPIIFYAGQNDFESGLIPYTSRSKQYHSPMFVSSVDALKYLDVLAQKNGWVLLYKPHPFASVSQEALKSFGLSSSTYMIKDVNINKIIDFADVTLTILSTVCYIALIRKKPVVMMGYTQLRHAGATYDAFQIEDIEPAINAALKQKLTAEQHANFVSHSARMSKNYLYGDGTDVQYHFYKGLGDLVPEIVKACGF